MLSVWDQSDRLLRKGRNTSSSHLKKMTALGTLLGGAAQGVGNFCSQKGPENPGRQLQEFGLRQDPPLRQGNSQTGLQDG